MPPKGNKKAKAETTPEPAPKPTPKSTPKKPKTSVIFRRLAKDGGQAVPIDVSVEGESVQAKLAKTGNYAHHLKLEAPSSFSLVKTIVFTEGPYEGQQAIILRPAKAFPFLRLAKEIRVRIYGFYFAQKGVVAQPISLDGKRVNKDNRDMFAKTYAEGNKNRVGLLAVNPEIHEEAIQVFYANTIKLESTTVLLDFLSQISTSVRPLLRSLEIRTFIKTTSRQAMHFLAESPHLQRLRIETSVFAEGDPTKAAKTFYADAYKFLEAVGAAKGSKDAGVDVLDFGKQAFTYKDEKKATKPWADALVAEFKENLRGKLK